MLWCYCLFIARLFDLVVLYTDCGLGGCSGVWVCLGVVLYLVCCFVTLLIVLNMVFSVFIDCWLRWFGVILVAA